MEHIFEILTTLTTLIAGGGWFVNCRLKKKVEKYSACSDSVDLTDKILHKYQENVLAAMNGQSENQEAIKKQIAGLILTTSEISDFLNGDFVEFQTRKRDSLGKFTSIKTLKSVKANESN